MPEGRNRLVDYLVYVALRVAAAFVQMFSPKAVYLAVGRLGNAWYRLHRRHRLRATDHVRASFPNWSQERVQQTVKGSLRNLAYLGIEALLTARLMNRWSWRRCVVLGDIREVCRILLERQTGAIFISGHFGGWEVAGYAMAALGFTGYAVARPLDNPYLNEYLLGSRQKAGLNILDKRGATEQMDDILGNRNYVGFIADQDAGPRGVFVDFFGRQASTYKAPSLVAMRHKAPIIVAYGRRLGEQYRFELGFQRIIYPHEWADKEDPIRWITQEYTAALEDIIRSSPDQYLWIYRRWKTRPRDQQPIENAPNRSAIPK
jgi:KDO2-lipid IV(A) lauroyltransferase